MTVTAAVLQYCARGSAEDTLAEITPLIGAAAQDGAQLICLPECASFIAENRTVLRELAETEHQSPTLDHLRNLARQHQVMLSVGSLLMSQGDDRRLVNRGYLISADGQILTRYDKIHMFDASIDDGQTYQESRHFSPGDRMVHLDTPLGHIGMSICYDLRFPHLYRQLALKGAEILLAPSAFTAVTGAAHWHVLLRARAIETGCYVLAAAQFGTHADGRKTYGHALIVDPWGRVIADAQDMASGYVMAPLIREEVTRARRAISSLTHNPAFDGA